MVGNCISQSFKYFIQACTRQAFIIGHLGTIELWVNELLE